MEALLDEAPRHKGLLLAAASGFTQYAYALAPAGRRLRRGPDLARATALRARARKLYLRALDYGLRGLEVDFPGLPRGLRRRTRGGARPDAQEHVPLLYWTAPLGRGHRAGQDDSELSADQALAEALMRRALALDEGYERGSIHDFFISGRAAARRWAARSSARGSTSSARSRSARAARVRRCVSFAETVSVARAGPQGVREPARAGARRRCRPRAGAARSPT